MSEEVAVRPVAHVDIERYAGLWFEIGRLPLKWEDAAATHITAQYTVQDDGTIEVDNRCVDEKGEPTQTIGRAKPVDGSTSKLTVSFLPQFLRWIPFTEGDYWVLKLDADYRYALVGTPDHKNLWLLAREAKIPAEVVAEYRAEAESQGFDLAEWITPLQDGDRVTDAMVEK